METPENSERLFDDSTAGALARRKKFLGKEEMSQSETLQKQACMAGVRATESRAIDKNTTQRLFQIRFPGRQGVNAATASAVGSLMFENGLIAYRLPNGDWVEPMNGHYVPASFPWAQMLEGELQWHIEQQVKSQGTPEVTSPKLMEPQTGPFAEAMAKVLGRTG